LNGSKAYRRLDQLLVERYPELSRSRIQGEIMAGRVFIDGKVCDKPGTLVYRQATLEMVAPHNPYAGRGGLKLFGALEDFSLAVKELVVLDIGSSTGGFTDCLLKNGAKHVYALDVGYGQLDWLLRQDPRVTVMERFNIRRLKPADLPEAPDLAVADLSFISLELVIPVLHKMETPAILALIKPQFEAGRAQADRGRGVIRDAAVHRAVLLKLMDFACRVGYCCRGLTYSRCPGAQGNLEFFAYWLLAAEGSCSCFPDKAGQAQAVVEQAHRLIKQ